MWEGLNYLKLPVSYQSGLGVVYMLSLWGDLSLRKLVRRDFPSDPYTNTSQRKESLSQGLLWKVSIFFCQRFYSTYVPWTKHLRPWPRAFACSDLITVIIVYMPLWFMICIHSFHSPSGLWLWLHSQFIALLLAFELNFGIWFLLSDPCLALKRVF